MKKITKEIREALEKAADDLGSQRELAKKANISFSLISKYIRGDVTVLGPGSWSRLSPHLAPYLAQESAKSAFAAKAETVSKMLEILEAHDKTEIRQILDAVSRLSGIGD